MSFWKTSTFVLAAMITTACGGGSAHARPEPAAPTELHHGGAPEGAQWEKLGERHVDGKNDRDTIHVTHGGGLKEIQLKVEGSSLELFDIVVHFGDGSSFSPSTRLVFAEGSKSRVIDLPGARRNITKIQLRYGNLPGGGSAKMEVFGR